MQNRSRKFVAYYRVSTKRQGLSGWGLDAQRAAVERYAGNQPIVAEFTEIESGRNCQRPQLAKAIDHCRLTGATLIIGKWDRLARDVAFTAKLMKSDVKLVAADNPHATNLTLHILAAVAEHEAEMISDRIKAALAAAKARGVKLGGLRPNARTFTDADRLKAVQGSRERSRAHAARVLPVIAALQKSGAGSLRELAAGLNERGIAAPKGGCWQPNTVRRVLAQA